MRSIVIVCIILTGDYLCQGEENLKNNKLKKNIRDNDEHKEFGVIDGTQVPAFTRSSVTLSHTWPIVTPKKEQVGQTREILNNEYTRNLKDKIWLKRNKRSPQMDYSHSILSPQFGSVNQASGQALNDFMNSRTSEESRIALENYMTLLETNDSKNNANIQTISNNQRNNDNIPIEYYSDNLLPSKISSNNFPNNYYAMGQHKQPVRYRGHRHRVAMNNGLGGGRPWLAGQSRIDSRPHLALYRDKAGPRLASASNAQAAAYRRHHTEKWESHPTGNRFIHRPLGNNNSPFLYQRETNNNHWISDVVENESPSPPQNDVYYSQLYAQSYDPNYYNYIAKTGKIKPWLYGKFDKHEDKSIWWELFNSFKNHGMKNMMNPIFLLGMTIPTLTIMLTALVQKRRSFGRNNNSSDNYNINEKLIDEYTEKLQRAIECYEKLIDNDKNNDNIECW